MRIFLTLLLLVLPAVAQETVDHSNAEKTIPQKARVLEPGRCSVGEVYKNTTTGALRHCIGPNTWADIAVADAAGNLLIGTTGPGGAPAGSVCVSGGYYQNGQPVTGGARNLNGPGVSGKCQAGIAAATFSLPA